MKSLLTLLLALSFLIVVHSQQSAKYDVSDMTEEVGDGQGETTKTGRAIGSSSKSSNKLTNTNSYSEDESEFSDSAFDNSPSRDPSEIIFPGEDEELAQRTQPSVNKMPNVEGSRMVKKVSPKVNPNKWKKIPLNAVLQLAGLGNQLDVETIFEKYVANVRLMRNNETQETYLADTNGQTLYNAKQEKIIVKPAAQMRTITSKLGIHGRSGTGNIAVPGTRVLTSEKAFASFNEISPRSSHKPTSTVEQFCIPERRSIPVPITVEPHILMIPKCVRVERCGGCCLSEKLACEPDSHDTAEFKVRKFAYIGGDGPDNRTLEYVDDEVIKVERHLSCSCKCKKKKEHCNDYQEYDERECDCVCQNQDDYLNCLNDSSKFWDKDSCMCACRELRECSSGLYYDLNTCSCKDIIASRIRSRPRTKRKISPKDYTLDKLFNQT